MKRILIIWALLISVVYAQSKAGFYVVGGKVITVQDTSSRKYLKAVENAGVTPTTNQNFTSNYLVTTEKEIGTWSLIVAQYPFIGGTAATHKFNMKDPRDLDAAFRLTQVGGGTFTHNANGIRGASASALNTFVNRNTLTNGNVHFSNYTTVDDPTVDAAMGVINNSIAFNLIQRVNALRNVQLPGSTINVGNIYPSLSVTKGYHLATISANSLSYLYKGVPQTASSANNLTLENFSGNIYIVGRNGLGSSSVLGTLKTYGYFSIGAGFTDTQAIQQSHIVTFSQSLLGRQ